MFHNPFRDLCGKLRSAVNLSVACSKNGRDSPGKRLGVKNGNGTFVLFCYLINPRFNCKTK